MSKTNLGRVSVCPKGTYSATTSYKRLDVVNYGSGSWMALQDCTGVEPADGAYWMKLVGVTKDGVVDALGYTPADLATPFELIEDVEITETGVTRVSRWIGLKFVAIVYDATNCESFPSVGIVSQIGFKHSKEGNTTSCTRYHYGKYGYSVAYIVNGYPICRTAYAASLSTTSINLSAQSIQNTRDAFIKGIASNIYYYHVVTDDSNGLPVGLKIRVYGVRV